MTTFALVHGAWHDHSCWDPTAALLRETGHDVVTMDLPCDDPGATLTDYAASVHKAIDEAPSPAAGDDLVVVGHSLGGLTIPLVAAGRPVRELVYLCAFVPQPGSPASDEMAEGDWFAPEWAALAKQQVAHGDGSSSWPADAAIDAFYHDCPADLAAWAATRLRRQHFGVANEITPLTAHPAVPARAIVCTEDRILDADSCARHAVERVAATVTRLGGGHSPMLAQPRALVDALVAAR